MVVCHVQPEQAFNLIFGYNAPYNETIGTDNAAAGSNTLRGTEVPSGEVWIVTSIAGQNQTRGIAIVGVGIYDGTNDYDVKVGTTSSGWHTTSWGGWLILPAGWSVRAWFYDCTAGDDLSVTINGFKMKLVQ